MTPKLTRIKAALRQHIEEAEKATTGPWIEDDGHVHSEPACKRADEWVRQLIHEDTIKGERPETEVAHCSQEYANFDADAAFITHARTMSPLACKGLLLAIEGLENVARNHPSGECVTLIAISNFFPDEN